MKKKMSKHIVDKITNNVGDFFFIICYTYFGDNMKNLNDLFSKDWFSKLIESILVIAIAFIIYQVVDIVIQKSFGNRKEIANKKIKTYIRLIRSIIKYVMIILTILIILQINGINVSSMVAGLGIVGIILGFAIQDALKDIIKGFDIISDSYYKVGDVIKFKDVTGKVLSIGIKTTKLEDVNTFNIVSISNRNIEQVEVVSNLINIDVPLPYELNIEGAEKVLNQMVQSIKKLNKVNNAEYRGVNNLADSSIKYQIKVYTDPTNKVQIRRDSLREILLVLEDNNIAVPYNQLDIHNKD